MKRLLAITLASSVALAMPVAALAQYSEGGAAPPAATDLQNPPNDAGIQLGTPTGADLTWEQLLQQIAAPTGAVDVIASINESSNIQFIDVAKLPGVPSEGYDQQLQASLDTAADGRMELQTAIMANSWLMMKLMEGGYAAEDVVAWAGDAETGFFFYVRVDAAAQPAAGEVAPAGGAAPATGGATGGPPPGLSAPASQKSEREASASRFSGSPELRPGPPARTYLFPVYSGTCL
jgi:hypothetical protein